MSGKEPHRFTQCSTRRRLRYRLLSRLGLVLLAVYFTPSAAEVDQLVQQTREMLRGLCQGWHKEEVQVLEMAVAEVIHRRHVELTPAMVTQFLRGFHRYIQDSIASSTPPHQHQFAKPETVLAYLATLLKWHVNNALSYKPPSPEEEATLLAQLDQLREVSRGVLREQGINLSERAMAALQKTMEEAARPIIGDGFYLGLKRPLTAAEMERARRAVPSIVHQTLQMQGLSEQTQFEDEAKEQAFVASLAEALVATANAVSTPESPQELRDVTARMDQEVRQAQKEWQEERMHKFREDFVLSILGASPEKEEQQFLIVAPGFFWLHFMVWGSPGIF